MENLRESMGELLFLVRFPLMTAQEFTDAHDECSVLTNEVRGLRRRVSFANFRRLSVFTSTLQTVSSRTGSAVLVEVSPSTSEPVENKHFTRQPSSVPEFSLFPQNRINVALK